ncbi:semaphorin-5A isoform X1 [Nematostella vectensis]|uniref:semaphorin-5A isoform X1 n=1 Tax=Nematostella vectensis TaxID=45351 RepID=UPI00207705BD|nr:semaphorin-5A isoform X1 [Nematostella vectensis]
MGLLLRISTFLLAVWTCQACKNSSHAVTSFQELLSGSGGFEFSSQYDVKNFSNLLLDSANQQLVVGARNLIIQIDLGNFSSFKVLKWEPSKENVRFCTQSRRPKEECYNYILVLQPYQGRLFTCGTNAYTPTCKWIKLSDLSPASGTDSNGNVFREDMDGVGLVPYSPRYKSTGIMSDQGRYYAGTMMDGSAREPIIFSLDFKRRYRMLRTLRGDDKWLSDAEFVTSFDVGLYVYFFFREAAVENMKCGKTRYSRVARICKGDYGGSEYVMKNTFVTFNKARLNCSTTGEYPAYYDLIQDVFFDSNRGVFYAVFTTQPNGVAGSAICAYSLDEINRVFNGDYKYGDDKTGEWSVQTNEHHFANCTVKNTSHVPISPEWKRKLVPEGMMSTPLFTKPAFDDSKRYQLMAEAVQPATQAAHYIIHGTRFSSVAVHVINNALVTYVGTESGSVLKLFTPEGHESACVIEEIRLSTQKGSSEPVTSLRLDVAMNAVYVATQSKLVKLRLARCSQHTDRRSCMDAHDPYCGWKKEASACTPWDSSSKGSWEQELNRCPVAKAKWSSWSAWGVCTQPDNNVCQCRTRACRHACDPSECRGEQAQLKECTVDRSSWADEATWLREGVIHGGWTNWAAWSQCSVTQGSGFRVRTRACVNPPPRNGGRKCLGNSEEVDSCSVTVPLEEKRLDLTSELLGVVGKDDMAMRHRYTCKVKGYSLQNMTLELTKTESIDCMYNAEICNLPTEAPVGVWALWSVWTKCRFVGMQRRERVCFDTDKPCQGLDHEVRECQVTRPDTTTPTMPTTLAPIITSQPVPDLRWDEWSACKCNLSVKFILEEEQKQPVGLMHRMRRCRDTHPDDTRCNRDNVQYEICFCKSTESGVLARSLDEDVLRRPVGYRLGDVVGAAIVTGVLCILLCAILAYCLIKRRKKFDVSRAHEKSMSESFSESRYERTNGTDCPSISREKNNSSKLHSVNVKGGRSITDFFLKRNTSPEAV